jgi:translation initiation factor IF-2
MEVPVTKSIGTCIIRNHGYHEPTFRCKARQLNDSLSYEVEFITTDIEESIEVVEDREDLVTRAQLRNGTC